MPTRDEPAIAAPNIKTLGVALRDAGAALLNFLGGLALLALVVAAAVNMGVVILFGEALPILDTPLTRAFLLVACAVYAFDLWSRGHRKVETEKKITSLEQQLRALREFLPERIRAIIRAMPAPTDTKH